MRFQKKPQFVDAMFYAGGQDEGEKVVSWILSHGRNARWHPAGILVNVTAGSTFRVFPGWWIVRLENGEFDSYEDEMFKSMYDPVEETDG